MAIELLRICGACERECPGWANRCPACGSLSLLHRITFVPAGAALPGRSRATASEQVLARPSEELASNDLLVTPKPARKSGSRVRVAAARDTKLRKSTLGGEPETRAV